MQAKFADFGFDFEGTYIEVLPDEGFTLKLSDDREVSVRFTEVEGKTELQLIFDAENENPHELQTQGWQTIIDKYKKYTEAN